MITFHMTRRPSESWLVVRLDGRESECGLDVTVTPAVTDEKLETKPWTVVVTLWRESRSVIRGKITHGSGESAYFQGGQPLAELSKFVGLKISPRKSARNE
jgi:hypothetical protein